MTENGLFVLGGPETQLHDILWAVHDGKNCGRSEGEENFGEFPIRVGGRGRAVTPTMRLYLPRVEARLRGITALWFCRKKGHLHTNPCNEQEWDKESWLTIATSHNT